MSVYTEAHTLTLECDVIKQHCASSFVERVTALIRVLVFLQPMRIRPRLSPLCHSLLQSITVQAESEFPKLFCLLSTQPRARDFILFGLYNSSYSSQHEIYLMNFHRKIKNLSFKVTRSIGFLRAPCS